MFRRRFSEKNNSSKRPRIELEAANAYTECAVLVDKTNLLDTLEETETIRMNTLITKKLGELKTWLFDDCIERYLKYMVILSGHSLSFGIIKFPFLQSIIQHWKKNEILTGFLLHIERQKIINSHVIFAIINTDDSPKFNRHASTGSHWVLCVIFPSNKKAYPIDSSVSNYSKLKTYCLAMAIAIVKNYFTVDTVP